MKTSFSSLLSFLLLINATASVSGLKFPIKKRSATSAQASASDGLIVGEEDQDDDIGNSNNLHYTTTIKLNGNDVTVLLDTGSSDLWVKPLGDLGELEDTEINDLELEYGRGAVTGNVAVTSFEFGEYTVGRQAFLLAGESTLGDYTDEEITGVFGLGMSGINSSRIQDAVIAHYGPNATWGAPVLKNIFDEHPDDPNIVAIALDRTDDLEDDDQGSFSIGEYDEDYADVVNMPHLYQYPENSGRWTTLLQSIVANGTNITLTSQISGVPSGRLVALLDSGTPHSYLPVAVADALYSYIPGAVKYDVGGVWLVPCNAATSVEFVFE